MEWIKSYLNERYQAVWIGHVLSDFSRCDIGVPQGSILGPLFFLIFLNDLPLHVESGLDSYADDTTITATGRSLADIEKKLTLDCAQISKWMVENKLKLDPEKTHQMTTGMRQRLQKLPKPMEVLMDNVALQEDQSGSELLLGCYIQVDLKWSK